MELHSSNPSPSSRGRLRDRGLDPDHVFARTAAGDPVDVATLFDIFGTLAASEKGGQGPTYALARLALRAGLPSEIADTLFLAYNQQSAEEAGHGDKVFGNAYFAMGGAPVSADQNVFDDAERDDSLTPREAPSENERILTATAARIGGVETAALQNVFPGVSALCEQWGEPIGRHVALQIRDIVRPEESRHVLTWRYVFHRVIAPRGPSAIDAFFAATNVGRSLVAAPELSREALERKVGRSAPTRRQLLGKGSTWSH